MSLLSRIAFALLLLQATSAQAREFEVHGYVTDIVSKDIFEIEDYRILKDPNAKIELVEERMRSAHGTTSHTIRIGTELKVKGDLIEGSQEIHASSIVLFLRDGKKVKGTALIEKTPFVPLRNTAELGEITADGQRIRVLPSTTITFRPNKSERKARGNRDSFSGMIWNEGPLGPLVHIEPNTFVTYEGIRRPDGKIDATELVFVKNELLPKESRQRRRLEPKVKAPDFEKGQPGKMSIMGIHNFKLVPIRQAQEYLKQLGESLIPEFQKSLPPSDPNRIPFRFFLVQKWAPSAFAAPNGTVVVFAPLIEILENEAQLAFILGHEIAHVIQEHSRRRSEYHRTERILLRLGGLAASLAGVPVALNAISLTEGAISAGHSRKMENQADRIGLGYLVDQGYDPREAPRVWKVIANSNFPSLPGFFWATHSNHTTRRSYLMAELRNNYGHLDNLGQNRDESEFQKVKALLKLPKRRE